MERLYQGGVDPNFEEQLTRLALACGDAIERAPDTCERLTATGLITETTNTIVQTKGATSDSYIAEVLGAAWRIIDECTNPESQLPQALHTEPTRIYRVRHQGVYTPIDESIRTFRISKFARGEDVPGEIVIATAIGLPALREVIDADEGMYGGELPEQSESLYAHILSKNSHVVYAEVLPMTLEDDDARAHCFSVFGSNSFADALLHGSFRNRAALAQGLGRLKAVALSEGIYDQTEIEEQLHEVERLAIKFKAAKHESNGITAERLQHLVNFVHNLLF